jgi:hypothetical protein
MNDNFTPTQISEVAELFQKYSRTKIMFGDTIEDGTWGELVAVPGKIKSGDLAYNTELKKVRLVAKCDKHTVTLSSGNVWARELVMKVIVNQ